MNERGLSLRIFLLVQQNWMGLLKCNEFFELTLARISNIGYKILRFYELEKEQTEFGNGI